ncbi:MAG: hypothetical protein ACI4T2_04440 [Christensenellales bacterium]
MMEKKQKIIWIVVFSVLGALSLASLVGLKFLREFKYGMFSMVIIWGIVLTIFQILRLKEFKKLLDEDMPLYLAELLNAGIITREQCLNPGKQEKDMFLSEHMSTIRKKRFFISLSIIMALYGISLFFLF